MERLQRFFLALLTAFVAACPVTTKVDLRNDSREEIEALSAYSDAVLARVAPSGSETFVYNQDCFRIRSGGEVLEFQPMTSPDRYMEVRTFSVRIAATFTRDKQLEITPREGQADGDPNISLKRGCPVRSSAN